MTKKEMLSGLTCDELCLLSNKKEFGKKRSGPEIEIINQELEKNSCSFC